MAPSPTSRHRRTRRSLDRIRSHYDVLGIAPDADADTVRAAYRARARDHHPDRAHGASDPSGVGVSEDEMAAINEAYRVLRDPGRRAVYDRSLRTGSTRPASSGAGSAGATTDDLRAEPPLEPRWARGVHRPGPARMPWKAMAIAATVGSIAVLVGAIFVEPAGEEPVDGILRPGSCVAYERNGDAREVPCTGDDDDLVVEQLVPIDARCPGDTEPHRDRLGLGIACVAVDPTG